MVKVKLLGETATIMRASLKMANTTEKVSSNGPQTRSFSIKASSSVAKCMVLDYSTTHTVFSRVNSALVSSKVKLLRTSATVISTQESSITLK